MKIITIFAVAIAGFALASCNTARSIGETAGGAARGAGNVVGGAAQGTVNGVRNVGSGVGNDLKSAGRAVTGTPSPAAGATPPGTNN